MLGEPKAAIRSMVLPFLLAFAVVEINQFVDTFWVSGLGVKAASAVTTVVPFYGMIMCIGLGLSAGATATMAFRLGKGDKEAASRLAANTILLSVILSVIVSVVLFLTFDILIDILGAQEIRAESWDYILPYILMSPVTTVASIIGGILRAEGAAKRSTIVQSSSALVNMVLDPILIYVLGMGVMGAGLATTLSAGVALIIGFHWYFRGKTVVKLDGKSFRIDKSAMSEVWGVGGPKTVQMTLNNITDFIQRIFLIIAGGTTAVMLYNYAWRYIGLSLLPPKATEAAMLPVCSSAFGMDDLEKMRTGYIYSLKLVIGITVLLTVLEIIFAEPLISILTYEESMRELFAEFVWTLRVSILVLPLTAVSYVSASMLQALKRAKIPMYFFMIWAAMKLVLYALAAYGYLGVDPFDGILYIMVGLHVFSGVSLWYFADREYKKLARMKPAAS